MEIYVRKDGEKHGPYSLEQLREHVEAGRFSEDEPACFDGRNWVTVAQVPLTSHREGEGHERFVWWHGSLASLIALLLPVFGIVAAMVVGVSRAWWPDGDVAEVGQVKAETSVEGQDAVAVIPEALVVAKPLSAEYEKALEEKLKTLGLEHPAIATSHHNLGLEYAKEGDYDKAIENCEKALAIRLKILGHEHPDVAGSYYNLGTTYADKGEREKAKACLLMAKVILVKTSGPEHPSTKAVQEWIDKLNHE
jgi:hypothetical protein